MFLLHVSLFYDSLNNKIEDIYCFIGQQSSFIRNSSQDTCSFVPWIPVSQPLYHISDRKPAIAVLYSLDGVTIKSYLRFLAFFSYNVKQHSFIEQQEIPLFRSLLNSRVRWLANGYSRPLPHLFPIQITYRRFGCCCCSLFVFIHHLYKRSFGWIYLRYKFRL